MVYMIGSDSIMKHIIYRKMTINAVSMALILLRWQIVI